MGNAANRPALPVQALQAQIERDQAQRVAALWSKPLLSDAEIAEALGLPLSTWQLTKRAKDAPPLFNLGRRVFARTADLRAWLDTRTAD